MVIFRDYGQPWLDFVDHGPWLTILKYGQPLLTIFDWGQPWLAIVDHG